MEATCEACLSDLPANRRLRKKSAAKLHIDSFLCLRRRCTCVAEHQQQDGAAVEQPVDLGEPIEEALTLADHAFHIGDDVELQAPSTVGAEFEEPDETAACAAFIMAVMCPASQEAPSFSSLVTHCEEAIRGFALVYQAVPLNSTAAKTQGAIDAINTEIANMEKQHVYDDYSTAVNLADLRRDNPEALVVFAHLLLGMKNSETAGDQKWKARLVAGGNWVTDGFGAHHYERDLHGAPTSLEAIRLVVWWSCMHPLYTLVQADMSHAYLQARLKGPAVHVVLPRPFWPGSWTCDGQDCYKFPALRLRKAMYGLRRSGFDWMRHAEAILTAHGWVAIRDYVDSLFHKQSAHGPLLLCLYVDDLLAAGHEATLLADLHDMKLHDDT